MFSDKTLDTVEFKSSWKKERSFAEHGAQTDDQILREVGIQAGKRRHAKLQTDPVEQPELLLIDDETPDYVAFMKRVEPIVCRELEKNLQSHAFENYVIESDEVSSTAITCVHTLCHVDLQEELPISGLSWNSTGSVIAAAYGRFDHEDWCMHKAALCTWNLDRRTVDENKPDMLIDLPCCLLCVAFHPENPAWIAGGNFNGEVFIWDLSSEDDMLLASSGIGDNTHREPVNKLIWLKDPNRQGYNLMSVSSDGKILIWKPNIKQQTLKLVDGFRVRNHSLPRSMMVRGSGRTDKEMGVTCLSFNIEDKDMFVVGSESGAIMKCSLQAGIKSDDSLEAKNLRSPVTFTYGAHHGPVCSVQCSPFHRNVFLSSAMDQTLRVYSILQAQPIFMLEPGLGYVFSAKWSPVRPTVLAMTTESGHLLVFDLKQGQLTPIHKVEASHKGVAVYSLEFNKSQPKLVATGDAAGFIQIHKLCSELITPSTRELDTLASLTSVTAE